jgi:hypothetical protein
MHTTHLSDLQEGQALGPLTFDVSVAASERYWDAAGVDHPARTAGMLYPPMAANLTILLLQSVIDEPVLHTAEQLRCSRAAAAGLELTVTGTVTGRYTRRDREYAVVSAQVRLPDGDLLWSSIATFTPVAT